MSYLTTILLTNKVTSENMRQLWKNLCVYFLVLPLSITSFTDRKSNKWEIWIERSSDEITLVFPAGREIIWHGDEKDRTGSDARTMFAQVNFKYQSKHLKRSDPRQKVKSGVGALP